MDYAKEFKEACEKTTLNNAASIYNDWLDEDSRLDDANFYLAGTILFGAKAMSENDKKSFDVMKTYYEESLKKKPSDPSLYDWYQETADKIVINFARVKK